MTHESSGLGKSSLRYDILNFTKEYQKDADLAWSAVLIQISQQRFIQSILFQGRFVSSFRWLHLIYEVK